MAVRRSAGLLVHRDAPGGIEVLLGHMGGPLWARRDLGGWSIPKGEYEPQEPPLTAAKREFEEELGLAPPSGELVELGEARQRSGKVITAWAVQGDLDPKAMMPGTFTMEWPRGTGRIQEFPELDRVEWFSLAEAANKLIEGQRPFLDRLAQHLAATADHEGRRSRD
jgi:predicted NUDIX family NTP pyrophosphohydrolase